MLYSENLIEFHGDGRVGEPAGHGVEKQAKTLWVDQAMQLSARRNLTPEARLAHYRAQCHAQRLPPDACFFSTAFVLLGIAVDRMADAPNNRILKRLYGSDPHRDEILADSGLEEGVERGPESITEGERADNKVLLATLREYGEPAIAELFFNEPEEFKRRYERGQKYLSSRGSHEHRWKVLDLFAFDGPVFQCRDCGEHHTMRD